MKSFSLLKVFYIILLHKYFKLIKMKIKGPFSSRRIAIEAGNKMGHFKTYPFRKIIGKYYEVKFYIFTRGF